MKLHEWLDKKIRDLQGDFEFRLETMIYRLTEKIAEKMQEQAVTRVQLAEKMNVSSAYVTKILRGSSNFTMKSLLKLADALNLELVLKLEDKRSPRKVLPFSRAQKGYLDSSTSVADLGSLENAESSNREPITACGGGYQ